MVVITLWYPFRFAISVCWHCNSSEQSQTQIKGNGGLVTVSNLPHQPLYSFVLGCYATHLMKTIRWVHTFSCVSRIEAFYLLSQPNMWIHFTGNINDRPTTVTQSPIKSRRPWHEHFPCSPDFAKSFAGSNLAEFDPAKNGSCGVALTQIARNNPAKMDKDQCKFLLSAIWPPSCEQPDASNVQFVSPLASHSLVAKSPLGATVPFLHNLQAESFGIHCGEACRDLCEVELCKVWPCKRLRKIMPADWHLSCPYAFVVPTHLSRHILCPVTFLPLPTHLSRPTPSSIYFGPTLVPFSKSVLPNRSRTHAAAAGGRTSGCGRAGLPSHFPSPTACVHVWMSACTTCVCLRAHETNARTHTWTHSPALQEKLESRSSCDSMWL